MFGVTAVWDRRNEPFVSDETRRWIKALGIGAEVMMLVQDATAGGIKNPNSRSILFSSPLRGDLSIQQQWNLLVGVHRTLTLDIWEPAEPPNYEVNLYRNHRPTIAEWKAAARQAVAAKPDIVELFNERLESEAVYADQVIRAVLPIFRAANIPTLADHPLTTYQSKHIAVRREWDLETTRAVARQSLADPRARIDETWLGAMPNSSTWTEEGAAKYMAAVEESKRLRRRINLFVAGPKRRKWGRSIYEIGLIDNEGNVATAGRALEKIVGIEPEPGPDPEPEPEPEPGPIPDSVDTAAAARKIVRQVDEGDKNWSRFQRGEPTFAPTQTVRNILDDIGHPWPED